MTTMSTLIASIFLAVSMRVSPLFVLLVFSKKSMMSAERRWAAREKLMRVRVESSKKRLTMTRPRRAGTFLTLRVETSLKESAVSRIRRSSSAERSSSARRCLRVERVWRSVTIVDFGFRISDRQSSAVGLRLYDDFVLAVGFLQSHVHAVVLRDVLQEEADEIGLDRELAA